MQLFHFFESSFSALLQLSVLLILLTPSVEASTAGERENKPHVNSGSKVANKTLYKPLYHKPSNSTPRFLNLTHKEVNPQRVAAAKKHDHRPRSVDLFKRQSGPSGTGTCAPGTPCSNGACCSKSGFCGYSPDFCGTASCISNCDAKAECGKYAAAGKQKCPLNVCCSQYGTSYPSQSRNLPRLIDLGFCGTTSEFCGTGCDTSGGGCGKAPKPSGSGGGLARSIGYYESW